MIVGFRDGWLRALFVDDAHSRNTPPDLEARLFRKLQMIDDAVTDQDLRVPPSNRFEKLCGNLAGFPFDPCSIRQWAADFPLGWRAAARRTGVYLDDHSYR